MAALRQGLSTLLDENRPLAERLDEAIGSVHGLGKAVATAILLVAYPEQYGVWNNVSEGSMRKLGLWPTFNRGTPSGEQYVVVNDLMRRLAADLGINLWLLDHLWRRIQVDEDYPVLPESAPLAAGDGSEPAALLAEQRFGLERHLHDFLRDNWEQTELGQEWQLYGEPGDDDPGYEFPTAVGYIDLLAKHRREARWLVVELKRENASDKVVGQILRYMGWVKRHLAAPGDRVEGLIIARQPDEKLLYALEMQPQVALKLYEVEFRLRAAPQPGQNGAVNG
jgi:hypothetical protein